MIEKGREEEWGGGAAVLKTRTHQQRVVGKKQEGKVGFSYLF